MKESLFWHHKSTLYKVNIFHFHKIPCSNNKKFPFQQKQFTGVVSIAQGIVKMSKTLALRFPGFIEYILVISTMDLMSGAIWKLTVEGG